MNDRLVVAVWRGRQLVARQTQDASRIGGQLDFYVPLSSDSEGMTVTWTIEPGSEPEHHTA